MIEIPLSRAFQLWEYKVSHGSLLIRSPKTIDQKTNIDLKFFGVEYISVPRHMQEITLVPALRKQIRMLESLLGKSIEKEHVFVIDTPAGRHIIVAAGMKIDENHLDIFESPFV